MSNATHQSNASGMAAAMSGLWFRHIQEAAPRGNFNLGMDPAVLSVAAVNPLDALRLMIEARPEDWLWTDEAAKLCGVDESAFSEELPQLSREAVERALGRLSLALFAAMRNSWRREQGRPEAEMEAVAGAAEAFFLMTSVPSEH